VFGSPRPTCSPPASSPGVFIGRLFRVTFELRSPATQLHTSPHYSYGRLTFELRYSYAIRTNRSLLSSIYLKTIALCTFLFARIEKISRFVWTCGAGENNNSFMTSRDNIAHRIEKAAGGPLDSSSCVPPAIRNTPDQETGRAVFLLLKFSCRGAHAELSLSDAWGTSRIDIERQEFLTSPARPRKTLAPVRERRVQFPGGHFSLSVRSRFRVRFPGNRVPSKATKHCPLGRSLESFHRVRQTRSFRDGRTFSKFGGQMLRCFRRTRPCHPFFAHPSGLGKCSPENRTPNGWNDGGSFVGVGTDSPFGPRANFSFLLPPGVQ